MTPIDSTELSRLRSQLFAGDLRPLEEILAIDTAKLDPHDPWALELRVLRMAVWRRSGRRAEVEAELAKLERDCAAAGYESAALGTQLERAKLQFNAGNLSETELLVREIINAAATGGHAYQQAEAHNLLGLVHSLAKDMAQSEGEMAAALRLFEELGEAERAADARSLLGMALVGQGRNLEGIALWREALRYFEDTDNLAGEVRLLERLGYAAWTEGDLVQTRRTLQRVLAIHEQHSDLGMPQVRLMTHYNLGDVDVRENKLDAALEQFARAEKLAQELGDKMLLSAVYLSRAQIAVLRGRASDALIAREAALQSAAEINLEFTLPDRCSLALIAAECEESSPAAAWPQAAGKFPDAGMRMSLRGIRQFLEFVQARALRPERQALYDQWAGDLARWLGEA